MTCARTFALATVIAVAACGGRETPAIEDPGQTIDLRSYRLGSIAAFAEMVDAGVKKLALSAPVDPAEMDALIEEAQRIAADHNVETYRESDFLVTDLFSEELTNGKHVLLIFRGDTRLEYMALKEEKHRLVELGQYEGDAREGVARAFGAMLSYSEEKIAALLTE